MLAATLLHTDEHCGRSSSMTPSPGYQANTDAAATMASEETRDEPCQRLTKSITEPSTPRNRRVIFPELRQKSGDSSSVASMANDSPNKKQIQKVPSLDSLPLSGQLPLTPLSPLNKRPLQREASPKSIFDVPINLPEFPQLAQEVGNPRLEPLPPSRACLTSITDYHGITPHTTTTDKGSSKRSIMLPFLRVRHQALQERIINPSVLLLKGAAPNSLLSIPSMKSASSADTLSVGSSSKRSTVQFDARVWICEFVREKGEHERTWYSSSEMDHFKRAAIARITRCTTNLMATGTGRIVQKAQPSRALFSHPALRGDDEKDDAEDELAIQRLASLEVRNILVVDPHDLCGKLLSKGLKDMFARADIHTVHTAAEGLAKTRSISFDIILVEERLKLMKQKEQDYQASGSALLKTLATYGNCNNRNNKPEVSLRRKPLFVGISAHYDQDKAMLDEAADVTWPKPPPPPTKSLRNQLLRDLLTKRGKEQVALRYFL